MRNMRVRTRIVLGFAAVILMMVALTSLSYSNLNHIKHETLGLTGDSVQGTWLVSRIQAIALQDYALAKGYLLSQDQQQKPNNFSELQANNSKLDELFTKYKSGIRSEKEQQIFDTLLQSRRSYLVARQAAVRGGQTVLAPNVSIALERQLSAKFDGFYNTILAETEFNKQREEASDKAILSSVSDAQKAAVIGIMLSIILALVSGGILVQAINQPLARVLAAIEPMRRGDFSQRLSLARNDEFGTLGEGLNLLSNDLTLLIGQVQKASIEVNTSVTEIAATAREQQATASEIAATTTEIGATSKEISATSRELVKSMNDVANVAEQTATLAVNGQGGLGRMQTTMHQIMEASGSINARLAVLNEKAGNINTVVTTIAKVADQTNLLSLNAAIEAEKAGEYGRGFAVVATEIRRLADQTAVATLDIEQMVKEMQSAVSAGVMGMDKFSEEVRRGVEVAGQVNEQLTQIIEQVQTLTPNFEVVNEGMQSQSVGAQQISDALSQLSEAAQQTVESLHQSNLAIEQMNETVRGLQSGISRFTLAA